MTEKISDPIADDVLLGATAFQQLCWLAAGRIDSIKPVKQIIDETVAEFHETAASLNRKYAN